MQEQLINNVSDTALWIAAYRALESERADAVFKDPLARKLAGERGFKMVEATPIKEHMAFAMVTRTTGIDRLINIAIERGIDTVINLGAGLDTRPYRMPLPVNLRWVEVDFPNMIDYKNKQLENEKPACHLQRIAADLSDNQERKRLFAQLGSTCKRALIITEGVVGYLTNEQGAQLSADIFATQSFHYWIMDYHGGLRRHRRATDLKKILTKAPLQFNVSDPIAFFTSHGWKVHENIFLLDEGDRIGRTLPPFKFPMNLIIKLFPKKAREIGNKTYGYVLFGK
ncbi:class I SAM-dependent methyltransferase [Niastella caeni]|uniref:S-adenosyl-L-methionine-dependent methyltransferase n=1 Tax=Niastella caeni TaxID=2569763 RepID=A0A4S8HJQ2_9BACT|nr:SAM-dependent methyltransferase [Niastella caeni]THU34841.1 class I SAM-dependent methyltransferase [Niastella caeni]